MGFTVRFLLGTALILLCFWLVQPALIHRSIRQTKNETQTNENTTQSIIANLKDEPKTEFSTKENATIDKQNTVVEKLEKSDPIKKSNAQVENGRAIDIEKYVSKEFHNKNNVYKFPDSPENEKFINPDFDFLSTTHKHDEFADHFDYNGELTTPKTSLFDQKYKEAVESVDQKLEHIDDDHEVSSSESESKENITVEKLLEETKKNDTKADLNYVNFKNIIKNDTDSKNAVHKDLVVEAGTNLDFHSSFNKTTVIDEEDNGNNTIVKEPDNLKVEVSTLSNAIPAKGDLDHAESVTGKSVIATTRKNIVLTKPPSTSNSSHISILSNKIESETVKAINPVRSTTEKQKGELESVFERTLEKSATESIKNDSSANDIKITTEQTVRENQVVPFTSESPTTVKVNATEAPIKNVSSNIEVPPKNLSFSTEPNVTNKLTTSTTENLLTEILLTSRKEIIATNSPLIEKIQDVTTTVRTDATTTLQSTTLPAENETTIPITELVRIETQTSVYSGPETTTIPTTDSEIISTTPAQKTTQSDENITRLTEPETVTSIVTETSVSPWERVTTEIRSTERRSYSTLNEIETSTFPLTESTTEEIKTTTVFSNYMSDSTAANTENIMKNTATEAIPTTQLNSILKEKNMDEGVTTESLFRTSKEIVFEKVSSTTEAPTTTDSLNRESEISVKLSTGRVIPEIITTEVTTTIGTVTETQKPETTVPRKNPPVNPHFRNVPQHETSSEVENSTDNTVTSDFYEHTDSPEDNSGMIAAISISSIGAVCLILLAGLLVIMRKRQKRFNYGQRCRPVSLDDYSMDNVSVYNSVRRKGMLRGSKRSYGNPAFEDPVCVSHPLNFPALGKFASNLEDIKAEFEDIPQITARTNELPEGCDTKNRYANVIPLPETRVFLSLIEGCPNSDYINANYVTGPKNTKGYYIACQAPLQNTVDDFWRMVWEQQCKVILMLTHLFENGVEKCIDYLPPSEVLDCHRLFGDFQVTLKKREVKDKYIISSLQLKNMVSNSWREVTHFWYLGWPEKGVPTEANSLIAFLIEARSYMKSSSLDRKDVTNGNLANGMTKNELNPVVVHCSPGTGRTGVVIACDIAIREFEQTRLVDVPRIVYKIRRDRASAVQTKEQYAFIYKVINLYATKLTGGALDSI